MKFALFEKLSYHMCVYGYVASTIVCFVEQKQTALIYLVGGVAGVMFRAELLN